MNKNQVGDTYLNSFYDNFVFDFCLFQTIKDDAWTNPLHYYLSFDERYALQYSIWINKQKGSVVRISSFNFEFDQSSV